MDKTIDSIAPTRLLVFENQKLLSKILSDISYWREPLIKMKEAYKELELGEFTQEVFNFIREHGTDGIINPYKRGLEDQLDATGVKNTKLRAIVLQGSDEPITNFLAAVKAFKSVIPTPKTSYSENQRIELLSINDLSYEEDKLMVSESQQEKIKEKFCRIYLTNAKEIQLYKNIQDLAPLLQNYVRILDGTQVTRGGFGKGNIEDHFETFFNFDREERTVTVNPQNIKWAINLKRY